MELLNTYYNFTLLMSILSCEKVLDDQRGVKGTNARTSHFKNHCQSFLDFDSYTTFSFIDFIGTCVLLIYVMVKVLILLISKVCKSEYVVGRKKPANYDVIRTCENQSRESKTSEIINTSKVVPPLVINIQQVNIKQFKNCEHHPSLEGVFEETVDIFFKELNQNLEKELYLPPGRDNFGTSLQTFPSNNVNFVSCSRFYNSDLYDTTQSLTTVNNSGERRTNEASKYWIYFQKFRRQVSWAYPDIKFDYSNFQQRSQADNRLTSICQFLYQRCSIKPKQWNVATFVVDYTLFLLEHELAALLQESGCLLKFSGFEGTGSAANGSLAGTVDRFEVLLVLNIAKCSEISVLHNKFCKEIPPGHIILSVKDCDNSKQTIKCCRKASIQGLSGLYLLPQEVEDLVEEFVKKAVLRLTREHKKKTDRLPFKIKLSTNKKLVISFDTSRLQEFGLGVSEINVKLISTVSIFVPNFGILPPLYVLPLSRNDVKDNLDSLLAAKVFLFGDKSNSDLLWEICTDKLQTSTIENIESTFLLSGVRSYHKECLMVLKALFSNGSENYLLNKGEIDAHVLDTVVTFLLQESSPSEWTLENMSDRISDAVHFLKAAYQNIWLPKYMIHNVHLLSRIPSLETMSSMLLGYKQNLLSHVTENEAGKVVDYIDQRLLETGMNNCMISGFSNSIVEPIFISLTCK